MSLAAVGLNTYIWNNNLRSAALLVLYPFVMMAVVWAICWVLGMSMDQRGIARFSGGYSPGYINSSDHYYEATVFANAVIARYWPTILTVIAIWFMIAWFFHTSMIRKLAHSHPVTRKEEPELYNLLENLCISQGMKTPRIEIIESHARNAFASGIDEKTFSITVTRGLMNSLQKDELEAVLAHELTHIINRDVRLLIIAIIFTGMFGFAAQLAWSSIRYNLFYAPRRRDNKGSAVVVIFIIALILWLGYIATLFMRFAISRRREYMADAGAVEMTKNPEAMMRALMRIAQRDHIPGTTGDIAMMCIENHVPFMGLFATHPPIEDRIKAISEITSTPIPELPHAGPADSDDTFSASSKDGKARRKNPWLIRKRRN